MATKIDNYGYSMTDACILAGVNPASYQHLREQTREAFMAAIPEFTANHFGISLNDLVGACRKRNVVYARNMMLAVITERYPRMSLNAKGDIIGGKNHSTIIHSLDTHADLLSVDREYRRDYSGFVEAIKSRWK